MKLIVGLGNPGSRYVGTRHNIGFEVVSRIHQLIGANRPKAKFDAEISETVRGVEKLLLMWPLTFMNVSGRSVRAAVDFFDLPLPNLLVVCDDLSLPVGTIRMRASGSSGGQKGLQSICELLGSQAIPRLRVGIGAAPPNWDAADFVLAKFRSEERLDIDQAMDMAVGAAISWFDDGIAIAMSRFNAVPKRDVSEESDDKSSANESSGED